MKKYLLILFLIICLSVNTVHASGILQTFKVEIGPFDAAMVKFSYHKNENAYDFFSSIQTTGIFDVFYSFQADYQTVGKIVGENFVTTDYTQTAVTSAHRREKKLLFNEKGQLYRRESSKDKEKKIVDIVVPQIKIDAFDIQTVFVMLIDSFQKAENCNLKKTIFNGKKIYHFEVKDKGEAILADEKVRKCEAFIRQENLEKGDLLWQVSSEKFILLYLSQGQKTDITFLKQLEIDSTPLGKLKATTQTFEEQDN